MSVALRYRQVHLDFHTSEYCTNVGSAFDADAFAKTLQAARVNSINLFAKCHHGYSYYPTKVGTTHPHLKFDLLGAQIEALHKRDILCPIYYSILWDELAGRQHPEWIIVNKEGTLASRRPLSDAWGWTTLDVSSGYLEYVLAQVEELIALYPVDGFWFDICFPMPNYSPWGKAQMLASGVNPESDAEAWEFARRKQETFFATVTTFIHDRRPDATIFYNGTMHRDMRRVQHFMTHLEVESLPTTGQWGYLHYPIMGRQARTYGKDFLGMNGRFHMSWGDFGGLKTRDQLDYECGTIVAAGGKICVGDQLNPNGVLDPAVYRLIGQSFARIEALEPWLQDATPAAELCILSTREAGSHDTDNAKHSPDAEGAAQMLIELGYQFDIVDEAADLGHYAAVLVPDGTALDDALLQRLRDYLVAGGRLVLSGAATLDPVTGAFQLETIPADYVGPAPTRPSYIRPDSQMIARGTSELADDYDYAFYGQAHVVRPHAGATTYGELRRALFNRNWDHFMGHQHAPVGDSLHAPLAVQLGHVLYFAAPLFSGYCAYDYWAYRAMAESILTGFLPPRLLEPQTPGWVEFSLHRQAAGEARPTREIVHVVCYHPRRTQQPIVHVDQSALTAGLSFRLRSGRQPSRVYLAPNKELVDFVYEAGHVTVALPPIGIHTVVVVE